MIEELNRLYEEGLLHKQFHPKYPLIIWNYSPRVQYEKLWTQLLMGCRGLVTDFDGNVVARPFSKFFNYEELTPEQIPNEYFDVYEKMDGSLGILFNYEGQWVLATRGSFASDQSLKGFFMLQKYDFKKLHKDYTYLFEIIYDDNRIVVKYDYEDLVLLGMINTETGYEVDLYGEGVDVRLKNMVNNLGFKVVKKYDGIRDYAELKGLIRQDEEGFVVRFTNGDRMKIKGEEYLRLHKLMTNVSTTSVWEMLSEDKDVLEILKDVPDEFYKKIKMYVQELRYNHYQFGEQAGKTYQYFRYGKYGDRDPEPTKKEFALHLQECDTHPKIKTLCFLMWDGKSTDKVIWNFLKPEYKKL